MAGSMTVVQQAWEDPYDSDAWDRLQKRYTDIVYRCALKLVDGRVAAARELVLDVFTNLHRCFRERGSGPIELTNGTFRHYVERATEAAAIDRRRRASCRKKHESAAAKTLDSRVSDPIAELDAEIDYRERLDREVTRCTDSYPAIRRGVQAEARTWEMFLRVVLQGEVAADLNRAYGIDRPGTVAQYVRQVRDRLFELLELPRGGRVQKDQSTAILVKVLERYERSHPGR